MPTISKHTCDASLSSFVPNPTNIAPSASTSDTQPTSHLSPKTVMILQQQVML